MDVFQLREKLTQDYATYAQSFIHIQDERIHAFVQEQLQRGVFWPDPLIQLNPMFKPGASVSELVEQGILHPECDRIFRKGEERGTSKPLLLHQHQLDAIYAARNGHNYILTTGTGSGKSLAYIVPIVDYVLRQGKTRGIQAIVVYPMNALANSQYGELEKFLTRGYPDKRGPVTFASYTGQENEKQRQEILANPPNILLTNYVMLELLMTRPRERALIEAAQGLRFLVLDELHTYRGRQGADVAMLVRRVRERLSADRLQCVGTSATLATEGTYDEQRAEIARVGTQLFGAPVDPNYIIGETLQRTTPEFDADDPAFIQALRDNISFYTSAKPPTGYKDFTSQPLSQWIESAFGVTYDPDSQRLVRSKPRSITGPAGAARELSQLTGHDEALCAAIIKKWLLAGYECEPNPDTGMAPFAFRLHQFISPGDTVYATIEAETARYLTLSGQRYVPGSREKILYPLVFCRECGQEYYVVRLTETDDGIQVEPRDFRDRLDDDEGEAGYLYLSSRRPWPDDYDELLDRIPEDWIEEHNGEVRIRSNRRRQLPQHLNLGTNGHSHPKGQPCVFVQSPFLFCLNCGVTYSPRQGDYGKLAALSSEGRSSATTILSLSAILSLKESDLDQRAQKLLSFTDNRQDASLQAGHFNDFVEVGLLRGAIYRAALDAGPEGLRHETIAQKVFDALHLPFEAYASEPNARFQAKQETDYALRTVLGYRIYRDLRRGWRITSPNLEQCGLLEIDYLSLDELCAAEDVWEACHPALATASPATRAKVAKVLLDYMRRELAIKVDYLDPRFQETIKQLSSQRLIDPWAIDENENMEYAATLYPRSRRPGDMQGNVYVSSRGGFGMYLRRSSVFAEYDRDAHGRIGLQETETIIRELLEALRLAGLVERVDDPEDDVPGYQLVASGLRWRAGKGEQSFLDPIRVPQAPEQGGRTNPFFIHFYQEVARRLHLLEAREHTAQVPYEERVEREKKFRCGVLPVLYCSPTMELGVDIAELNVVNMRNVPPTPANYAQRSGRAGRSGQPALVFTYCSAGSPHDQYFFKRPERMVSGAVTPPRLDLTNQDMLRAHVHAIWLAEANINLGETLKDILDMSGEEPSLQLLPDKQADIDNPVARQKALARARRVLEMVGDELQNAGWYRDDWLDKVFANVARAFDATCDRWRNLYRAALKQARNQDAIIRDASRSPADKRQAMRLRTEAESQLRLLTEIEDFRQSDFYSYRYFATEGFLPGYSFPRLPISAFVPARRVRQRDEFLSRPRFLAVSEFGPRAIIYHEGSRYIINQVILPVDDQDSLTSQVKQCGHCGYIHPLRGNDNYDLCQRCRMPLGEPLKALLRMQNVVTKRRDRINSDEEERLRMGYEIRSGVRFPDNNGQPEYQSARLTRGETVLAQLTYAQAATLYRINLGWLRRKQKDQYGFVLDIERGYWARNEQLDESQDLADPMSSQVRHVIPYVEDTRNALLIEPAATMDNDVMAALQAALKRAIETIYQLEDNELAAEPLPDSSNRRILLFYEAAEGGAGVLRRLVEEPHAFAAVARQALEICHFDPDTGADLRRAPRSTEDCEAACYDCLLSYSNQREHAILDRHLIRQTLLDYASAVVAASPTSATREEHVERLYRLAGSELEREWLDYINSRGYRLPDDAQVLFEDCNTRPDFVYRQAYTVVYIDGSHHDYPHRQERDRAQVDCMEDRGYTVIRFGYRDDWDEILAANPHIFGVRT